MGTPIKGQFTEIVSMVLRKYAKGISRLNQKDLRQDAELVLLKAQDRYTDGIPDKLAYQIVKNLVINYIQREMPPRFEDISDPSVLRKYDKQTSYQPDLDTKIDADKAVHLMNQLPEPHRFVLTMLFGLEGNKQYTEEELAEFMSQPRDYIKRIKKVGLARLKNLME
jgi:DNA-directed RNA polymerase specialized sigma24 family protein